MSRRGGRALFWFAARVAISAIALIWIVQRLGGDLSALRGLRWPRLWPAATIFALSTVLGAWQWHLLLRQGELRVSFGRSLKLYWAGLFASNFLPSNVGGDLLKVSDLALGEGGLSRPVAATLLDRLIGLFALVLLAALAGLWLGGHAPAGVPWWLFGIASLPVVSVLTILLSRRLSALLLHFLGRIRRGERLRALLDDILRYRRQSGRLLWIFALAIVVQLLRLVPHLFVARELGWTLGLQVSLQLTVLVTILALAMVLPISLNGVGLREAVATQLLPQIGIGAQEAVSWQLATYLVQVAVSLVGGLIFAVELSRGRLLRRREAGGRH